MGRKEIEEAFAIVWPIASMCGVSKEDTEIVVKYFDEMRERSVSARDAGFLLRQYLKDTKNENRQS